MILATDKPREVGATVANVRIQTPEAVMRHQPVYIVREATREEWEAFFRNNSGRGVPSSRFRYFYEVSTD